MGGALHGGAACRWARLLPSGVQAFAAWNSASGSQINVPIAVLIWLMITPDDDEGGFRRHPQRGPKARGAGGDAVRELAGEAVLHGLAGLAVLPPRVRRWIAPAEADQYIAGCIILAAAPCTAMVFVWSHLTGGDPAYTLVQVSVNDLIMLVAFVPIVRLLVTRGVVAARCRSACCCTSVIVFIVIPLAAGHAVRAGV